MEAGIKIKGEAEGGLDTHILIVHESWRRVLQLEWVAEFCSWVTAEQGSHLQGNLSTEGAGQRKQIQSEIYVCSWVIQQPFWGPYKPHSRPYKAVQHSSLVAEFSGLYISPEGRTRRGIQLRKGAATAEGISALHVGVLEGRTAPRTQPRVL